MPTRPPEGGPGGPRPLLGPAAPAPGPAGVLDATRARRARATRVPSRAISTDDRGLSPWPRSASSSTPTRPAPGVQRRAEPAAAGLALRGRPEWEVRLVGLSRSPAHYEKRGITPARQAEAFRRIASEHGMPIDTRERPRMAASLPACRAVVRPAERAGAGQDPVAQAPRAPLLGRAPGRAGDHRRRRGRCGLDPATSGGGAGRRRRAPRWRRTWRRPGVPCRPPGSSTRSWPTGREAGATPAPPTRSCASPTTCGSRFPASSRSRSTTSSPPTWFRAWTSRPAELGRGGAALGRHPAGQRGGGGGADQPLKDAPRGAGPRGARAARRRRRLLDPPGLARQRRYWISSTRLPTGSRTNRRSRSRMRWPGSITVAPPLQALAHGRQVVHLQAEVVLARRVGLQIARDEVQLHRPVVGGEPDPAKVGHLGRHRGGREREGHTVEASDRLLRAGGEGRGDMLETGHPPSLPLRVARPAPPYDRGVEIGVYTFAELTPDPAHGRARSAPSSGCAT